MSQEQMSAEELADRVNKYLKNKVSPEDKRFAPLTKRRILDYTTKGLLLKPFKNGNKNFYTNEHFNQLVSLRELQATAGVSEKTLLKAVSSSSENINSEKNYQEIAKDILSSFEAKESDDLPNKVLKSIASEYLISSSLSSIVGTNNNELNESSALLRGSLGNETKLASAQTVNNNSFKFHEQVFEVEDNERNQRAIVQNQLRNEYNAHDMVFEVVPGMKIIVSKCFEIEDEQKIRNFMEKFISGFKKISDGS